MRKTAVKALALTAFLWLFLASALAATVLYLTRDPSEDDVDEAKFGGRIFAEDDYYFKQIGGRALTQPPGPDSIILG